MTVVGKATVEVRPDVTGFGPRTEAAVKRALEGIRAQVEMTLDENNLRTKIASAVRAASTGLQAKVGADVDTSPIKGRVKKAVEDAVAEAQPDRKKQLDLFDIDPDAFVAQVKDAIDRGQQLELDIDFDFGNAQAKAQRALDEALAGVGGRDIEIEAEVDVDVDEEGASAAGDRAGSRIGAAAQRALSRFRMRPPPPDDGDSRAVGDAVGGIFGRAVLRSAARVLAAGAIAQILIAATSGATALGGALIAATGAAGSLVATAAALPAILSAAAQAAATIGLALGGIGNALKAHAAMEKAVGAAAAGGGGGGGGQSASAARAAERAIRNATRGVEDAQRALADAVEAANDRIADAERSLSRAQRSQLEAQEDLTRARVEARLEVEELRRSVERLTLTEAEARRRLTEARIRNALAEQRANQDLTGVTEDTLRALERQAAIEDRAAANPREKAANELRDAELDLQEVIADRTQAEAELAEVERTGIEGTRRVVDARQDLVDADERVAEAERDLTRAHRDLVRAHEDGARRIAEAQENLADAIAAAAEGAAGAAGGAAGAINRYQAALDALNPYARRFVEFLVSLKPRLEELQATAARGLLPGVEQAIRTVLPILDDLEPVLFDTATALAALTIEAANLVASPGFRSDLVTQGRRNIEIIQGLGLASIASADAIRHITIAAGPLAQHLVALTLHYANLIRRQAEAGRESGRMEAFFGRVQSRVDRLLVTLQFLGTGLFRVFRDATPQGDRYLDMLTNLAARFDIITRRASESGALSRFFSDSAPAVEELGRLVDDLVTGLFDIGRANLGAFTAFTSQIRTELLPAVLEVLAAIDTDFLSAIVSLTTAMAGLFGAVLTGNPALTVLVEALGGMAEGITRLLADIPILSPILQAATTALGALGIAVATTNLARLASGAFGAARAIDFLTNSTNLSAAAATRLQGAFLAMTKLLTGIAIGFGIKAVIDSIAPSVDSAVSAITRAKDPLAAFDAQMRKLEGGGSVVERVATNIRNIFNEGIPSALGKSDGAVAKTTDAFRQLAIDAPAAAQAVVDGMRAQGRETGLYDEILRQVIADKAKQGVAEDVVRKKVEDATAALRGANAELERHTARLRDATNQALSLSGAEIATEEAVDRLTQSLAENGLTFDTNTEKGRANKRALDDLIGSIQREIVELANAAAAGQLDNARKERLIAHLEHLARSGYPGARDQAQRLREQLEAIQTTYTANVDLNTTRAVAKIEDLTERLRYLSAVGVSAQNNINLGTAGDPVFAREFGGRVERNRAYIVGEKRPELFIPDENGVVLPQVPDIAVPKNVTAQIEGLNLMPAGTDFDMEGLRNSLDRLEVTLTDNLAAMEDLAEERRGGPSPGDEVAAGTRVEQNFNEALVKIEATFGPGSAAADIIEAMEQIVDQRLANTLAQVLRDHRAGVGTREM